MSKHEGPRSFRRKQRLAGVPGSLAGVPGSRATENG